MSVLSYRASPYRTTEAAAEGKAENRSRRVSIASTTALAGSSLSWLDLRLQPSHLVFRRSTR